ncbi:MAG: molybdopterin molybdenumtransferase MoeA, partial [Desulfobulbia bacterium]
MMIKEAIVDRKVLIGFDEALRLTLKHIGPLSAEVVPLSFAVDRVVAVDITARVDSPSIHSSLKDGYAVLSADIGSASADNPVPLKLIGEAAAGGRCDINLTSGNCVRILTGARLPAGSDAVVTEEFVSAQGKE